jgi:hypothetical protein
MNPKTVRIAIVAIIVVVAVIFIGRQVIGSVTKTTQLGLVVTASGIDGQGCPTNRTSVFSGTQTIYVVALESNVKNGDNVFARLFANGTPVEDSPVITANQDYTNTCIYFQFEPTSPTDPLDLGSYQAQMIVNGNPGSTVDFTVQ